MSFGEIIAKVKAHPELWQSAHPFYRHRIVSARTWKQIAAELRADDWIQIKKRWKHMKDSFRKEVKKVTTNQIEHSSWIHYSELEFLTEEIIKKQVIPESEGSENETEQKDKPVITKIVRKRKRLEPTLVETKSQNSIKFKKIIRSLNTLCKHVGKSTSFVDDDVKNDPDYMFLVSLLPTMKNLSDIQRLHFRGKINNWLLSALVENEISANCDNKAKLQTQINEGNIKDCKIELDDRK